MFDSLERAIDDSWWGYLVISVVALLDSVIPVVPSESLVILGGVLSSTGSMHLPLVIGSGVIGAVLGDNLSYLLGRRAGPWIKRHIFSGTRASKLEWARRQLERRGMMLIITARFIPGGRTAVTLTCGITRQPWPRFLFATIIGAIVWANYAALLGYLGGETFKDNHTIAFVVALGLALSVTAAVEVVRWWIHRGDADADADDLAASEPPV